MDKRITTLHAKEHLAVGEKLTETEKAVLDILETRWATGRAKYGKGISHKQHKDFSVWIDEAIEECADQLQYLVAAKITYEKDRK